MKPDSRDLQNSLGDVPRSRSGRIPQWVIDEATGRDSQPAAAWRSYSTPPVEPSRRHGRRRWLTGITSVLVVLAVVGIAVVLQANGVLKPPAGSSASSRPTNWPIPSKEESNHQLGVPAALGVSNDAYRFSYFHDDGKTPLAYDPCRPIHYVIRMQGEPKGGNRIVKDAISRVSLATGLHFTYDGATTEAPSIQRESYQPKRYGDRWAPVLIAWVDPKENADFAAGVIGLGGSTWTGRKDGTDALVTGTLQLDAVKFAAIIQRPNGTQEVRAVVLHELGHLVGLAHVTDPHQLMYPQAKLRVNDFGAGDLNGLAVLGRGQCVPDL